MVTSQQKRGVGFFSNAETVEKACQELQSSGFSMDKVSVIGKDAQQGADVSGATAQDRVGEDKIKPAATAVADTVSNSAAGVVLFGLTSLVIPGLGPILAAGSLVGALSATAAATGVSAVASNNLYQALSSLGIPEDKASDYGDALLAGQYLVIVEGSEDELNQATQTLSQYEIKDWSVY
ncbi:MAG: general stress protein [Cyanobacteria bacterium Co-bin8]|nr:general stress protein [Cyanobacteria bacterium Co-bin8]